MGCSDRGKPSKSKFPEENVTLDCNAGGRKITFYVTKSSLDVTVVEDNKSKDLPMALWVTNTLYIISVREYLNSEQWEINRKTLFIKRKVDEVIYDGNCLINKNPRL
jgi:hypothetical protein